MCKTSLCHHFSSEYSGEHLSSDSKEILHLPLFYRDENDIVPQVVKAVLSLPGTAHLAIRYTSIKLFGELSEWAEKHADYLGKTSELCL